MTFSSADSVLLMMSGGPDSTFLFWQLLIQQIPFSVVHFNHNLRGNESDTDAEFVRALCIEHNKPFAILDIHLKKKHNLQNEARIARYSQAIKLAKKWGCRVIATAHHFDDQVETLVMRKMRGSGLQGFCGIQNRIQKKIYIWRPLLHIQKVDILNWLKHNRKNYREDSSNTLMKYHRNRIRNQLTLKDDNQKALLESQIDFLQSAQTYFDKRVHTEFSKSELRQSLNKSKLELLTEELQFRTIKFWLKSKGLTWSWHKNTLHSFLKTHFSRRFKNGQLIVDAHSLYFLRNSNDSQPTLLKMQGAFYWGEQQMKIVCHSASPQSQRACEHRTLYLCSDNINAVYVDKNKNHTPFLAFKRKSTKTINQFLKDKKIPPFLRQKWPVLIDHNQKVMAILGIEIEDQFKITAETNNVLQIKSEWPYTLCK